MTDGLVRNLYDFYKNSLEIVLTFNTYVANNFILNYSVLLLDGISVIKHCTVSWPICRRCSTFPSSL